MNEKEWHAKLEEWAFDDARLHRMPLALLPILAEHLANHGAAQPRVQADVCQSCGTMFYSHALYCHHCGTRR